MTLMLPWELTFDKQVFRSATFMFFALINFFFVFDYLSFNLVLS